MSKSSFSVLGFASAIFFTFFILSLFYAQSVDGIPFRFNKKIVTVENDIDPKISLKIHCRSSDDDLGEHTLYYKQSFYWKFRINAFSSTKFICTSSWYDPNGKSFQKIEFYAYHTRRDYNVHCSDECFWSIRRDGGYYGKNEEDERFPFEKMFSYK
ncbi:hypothetical protein MKX03_017221 [Papaver bracteatum]|nr:hypothetical protein MKX03_017221 [Papaver bracteatum]